MKKIITIKSTLKKYKVIFNKSEKFEKTDNYIYIVDRNFYKKNRKKFVKIKPIIILNAKENVKSFENLSNILKKIFNLKPNRKTKIICIGGGILQDVSSFLSSIIMRGIDWIYYPTTLLSQADSCIGGKTSINFKGLKNQLGNFYPPSKIIINTNFLKTLSKKDVMSGIGEMAHYFLFEGKKSYNFYKKNIDALIRRNDKIMSRCVYESLIIKKKVIEKDEFDNNYRLLLNYGHTFGHALEKYTNYQIPHGLGVAHGMTIANFLSMKFGYLSKKQYIKMNLEILSKIHKNRSFKNFDNLKYIELLKKDKKNTNTHFKFIFTKGPGKMFIKKINKNNLKLKIELKKFFHAKNVYN